MQLKGFEMLKAIILDPTPFSIERDLITPTFKLKRPQLLKYYKVSTKFLFFLTEYQYQLAPKLMSISNYNLWNGNNTYEAMCDLYIL